MPTFSVITVCFNEASHIRETLDSIVGQTFTSFELIVVDGGSTDGTKDIISQYAGHISWWCSEPDRGTYHAMNKGVEHATGDYVIFMNGGDCFHDNNVLAAISRHLSADVIEGVALRKDNSEPLRHSDPDIAHKLLTDGISHQSAFIRRELLQKYPYDEQYKIVADWKFWLLTLLRDRRSFLFLDDVVVADTDMTGITYSGFAQNLKERSLVLDELKSDKILGLMAGVMQDYDYLTHNTLVQYAAYLDRHSPRGYQLVRKIAKRVVKFHFLLPISLIAGDMFIGS